MKEALKKLIFLHDPDWLFKIIFMKEERRMRFKAQRVKSSKKKKCLRIPLSEAYI